MNAAKNAPLPSLKGATMTEFHRALAEFNRRRLTPSCNVATWQTDMEDEVAWRLREHDFVALELDKVRARAAEAPTDPAKFVAWFEQLKETGPGQGDPLFTWLAEEAPYEAMHWFLTQEVAGEAGFDDLVALTQVKMPAVAKLELARNYWDEMGQGKRSGMHGPMLDDLAREMEFRRAALSYGSRSR